MNIILSNYRYFVSGGPEKYLFTIQDMLRKSGNNVFPFSVRSRRNMAAECEPFFLSPISAEDGAYFHEYKKDLKTTIKVLSRQFYSLEGFIKSKRYVSQFRPDIVYILHFMNKMSPSIIDGFKSAGVPVVVRLSDFNLICPQSHLFDNREICEDCLTGGFFQAARKKCIIGSRAAGLIKALAWNFHRLMGSLNRIDAFVCPSKFTLEKYAQGGFPREKLNYIPTFIDASDIVPAKGVGETILYLGRLTFEKGVHVLLEAYAGIADPKPKLVLIGQVGETEYSRWLLQRFGQFAEFLPFMERKEVEAHIQNARFLVIPSLWYENLPNVLLEANAYSKAVIVPNHGCFKDLVRHGETGLLYEPGPVQALQEQLEWAIGHEREMVVMGQVAREYVISEHKPDLHYVRLMRLFKSIIKS